MCVCVCVCVVTCEYKYLLSAHTPQATVETVTASQASGASGLSRRRARINTKLRSQGSGSFEIVDTTKDTFFDRNFPGETEVLWFKFQQAFISDYEAQLTGIYTQTQPSLLAYNIQYNTI